MSQRRALRWAALAPWLIAALAALAVGGVRPWLAREVRRVKVDGGVFPLPASGAVVAMSLGYRSALADYLWADTLIQYGMCINEDRLFEHADAYLDTIDALDPEFRDPYLLADTIVSQFTVLPSERHYFSARRILERGTRRFPDDPELWLNAGEYIGYVAANWVSPEHREEWRQAGARLVAHACDLADDTVRAGAACTASAGRLSKAGELEAATRLLRRVYATTSDPAVRARTRAKLQQILEGGDRELQLGESVVERRRRVDLLGVGRDLHALLPPAVDAARCAGVTLSDERDECRTSWRALENDQ